MKKEGKLCSKTLEFNMEIDDIKRVIAAQSAIQKNIFENKDNEAYEIEACEIISYLAILDFWKFKYPSSITLQKYQANNEEGWECINKLFNHYVSENSIEDVEPEIMHLIAYFYEMFYYEKHNENGNDETSDELNDDDDINLNPPF